MRSTHRISLDASQPQTACVVDCSCDIQSRFTGCGAGAVVTDIQIYQYAGSPYDDQQTQAWAAAFVLVVLVLVLNVSARLLVRSRVKGAR